VLRTLDDRPAWQPEQAVTVEEALHATCVTPAWLAREEHSRGKLIPGYDADLVVLDRDPLEGLADVQVVATMLAGSWTHNPPPWD
jgi:predicted amidohydrolase YtcJ